MSTAKKRPAAPSRTVSKRTGAAVQAGVGAGVEMGDVFELLKPVVALLGGMIGDHIEVVLHDLSQPGASVMAIANGHISGRSIGDPILSGPREDAGFRELYRDVAGTGRIDWSIVDEYQTTNAAGRRLRSATLLFRDRTGAPAAALCLNADMTVFEMAYGWLEQMLHRAQPPSRPEPASRAESGLETMMQEIIDDAVKRFMKPPALMNKEEKMYAVEAMMERGLFLIRNSVNQVALALGVSRFTIYNYIDQIKRRDNAAQTTRKPRAGRR